MHNYAGISQLKFNVHTIYLDNSTETKDCSEALLVQPPNTPNKKSKKGDHDSSTSTSNPTINTPTDRQISTFHQLQVFTTFWHEHHNLLA
ncbi:hypothetical protein RHGRI_021890 [Rhododendron griersonianum]|uniref:Uncharacterized protein n=1 Tax=Rhododendron griersonianum TaxID=479676 RepID=A0AAV6JR85_9ERIC|nr:hypothetical protein RHGRI_021890 [Rhododendron griersonianum]KAG5542175.1 hypothetical protein RHGRI_021890 [Rhododendron griersonianum]